MDHTQLTYKQHRQKRKKNFAPLKVLLLSVLMAVILTALRTATSYVRLLMSGQEQIPTASVTIDKPTVHTGAQLDEDLKQFVSDHPAAKKIYENQSFYPETLLAAYLNNPEMEDFVMGYPDADGSLTGPLTKEESSHPHPLLLQWDKRWGYAPYGESIIGLSGCGPTCLSMVLLMLTGDSSYTPAQIAAYSDTNGYYVSGSGTSWSLMTTGASQLGLSARELPLDETVMKNALDNGEPIICSMGAGDFTTQGHFIMIYSYNGEGFLVNDPNCIARSSQVWTYDRLQGQIKNMWAYHN